MAFDTLTALSIGTSTVTTVGPMGLNIFDDLNQGAHEATKEAAQWLVNLIKLSARPGKTLTGVYAVYWPIYKKNSYEKFFYHYSEKTRTVTFLNRERVYPEIVEKTQGSIDRLFSQSDVQFGIQLIGGIDKYLQRR